MQITGVKTTSVPYIALARSSFLVKLGLAFFVATVLFFAPMTVMHAAETDPVGWWPRMTAQIEKVWSIAYTTAGKIFSGEALQVAQLGSSNNELVSPTDLPVRSGAPYVPTATSEQGTLVINAPLLIDTNLRISGLSTLATTTILGLLTIDALQTNTLATVGAATLGSASVGGTLAANGGITTGGADIDLEGGQIFASNIVNQITAGDNIVVTGTQSNPVISVDLEELDVVLSLNGETGELDLEEGDDIEINGLTIENVSTLDTVRDRGGCSGCILDSDVADLLTIFSGTIDDTVIGADTAAAAYFTHVMVGTTSATTTLTVNGTFTKNGTATSTFGGGINITDGCYAVNGVCIAGAAPASYVGLTDTPSSLVAGALQFANATGSALMQSTGLVYLNDRLGIGTSTPTDTLTVVGDSAFTGGFVVTNSTSSLFVGGINVTGGCVAVNGTCLGGTDVLAGLTDVALATTTAGDLLQYDGVSWVNVPSSALGYGDGTYLGLADTPDAFIAGALQFANATGSALTQSALLTYSNGSLQLGTSSVATRLSVDGDASLLGRGTLRFYSNGANYVGFRASTTLAADTVWTLPTADGSANHVLVTDGAGNLRFASLGSVGGGVETYLDLTDTPNSFVAGAIQYAHASGTYLTQNSNFVFTGTNLGIGVAAPTEMLSVDGDVSFLKFGGQPGLFYDTASGRLGLGTTTPSTLLSLVGGSLEQTGGDAGNDYTPQVVGGFSMGESVFDIEVVADRAYVVSASAGNDFHVVDVTTPASPSAMTAINLNGAAQTVAVRGTYAFVGTNALSANFIVIDVSDDNAPLQVASLTVDGEVNDIAIAGHLAYVVTNESGDDFEVVDVTDPLRPVVVGSLNLPTSAFGVAVDGAYAYVALNSSGDEFYVIDISDPTQPTTAASVSLSDVAYKVQVQGSFAYVTTSSGGDDLHIIDISDPTTPTEVGSAALDAGGRALSVAGGYAYVATLATGDDIEVVNVTNPSAPFKIGGASLGAGDGFGIAVIGRYAYMTTGSGGNDFHVIDVSGATFQSALVSSLSAGSLAVSLNATIDGQLRVKRGLMVGREGIISNGALYVTGTGASFMNGFLGIGTTSTSSALAVEGSILSTTLLGGSTNVVTDANGVIIRDPSDVRLKESVTDIDNALELLTELRGVRYEWIDKERFGAQTEIGFIAQEVDLVLPEVVSKGGDYWSLNKSNMIAVVVEAVKELWDIVRGQGEAIDALEARIAELEARQGMPSPADDVGAPAASDSEGAADELVDVEVVPEATDPTVVPPTPDPSLPEFDVEEDQTDDTAAPADDAASIDEGGSLDASNEPAPQPESGEGTPLVE
jgi:hypothetical protein